MPSAPNPPTPCLLRGGLACSQCACGAVPCRSPAIGQHLYAPGAFRRCAGQGWSGLVRRGSTPPSPVGRVLESGWGRRHLSLLPGGGDSTLRSPVSRRCRAAVRSAAAGCRGGADLDRGRTGRQRTLGSQGGQGPRSEPVMTQQPAAPSAGAPRPRPWAWCRLTGVEGPRWTGPSDLWNTPGGHTFTATIPPGGIIPLLVRSQR